MAIRKLLTLAALSAGLLLGSCDEPASGPVRVSAIGRQPQAANPNLHAIDPPTALLLEATAQGLVRFDATGQIEPALAQSWILSDDGLRYTFRLARTEWADGSKVTARQVVQRLRAAFSRASRNPLKPVLGVVDDIEAMTDNVLELSLKAPRPNFLQLLAQPEMAVMRNGAGTGPYRARPQPEGALLLTLEPAEEDEEVEALPSPPDILLRGESAALAVARFRRGLADLVVGGTTGDLPFARARDISGDAVRFDPVSGLFGLAFIGADGLWAEPAARSALSMAVDRGAIVSALGVPELLPRTSLIPPGIEELPAPAAPAWAEDPLPMRRETARATLQDLSDGTSLSVRVALPAGPGYRLVFAHLRRDWSAIGVRAIAVAANEPADLKLVDAVAPVAFSTWFLRQFTCGVSPICSAEADALIEAARNTAEASERRDQLAAADRIISDLALFIPIAAPVRWALVSPRLTGFQPNSMGRRFPGSLVAPLR